MFLTELGTTEAKAYLEKERVASGFVMNLERAWAWRPDMAEGFAHVRQQIDSAVELDLEGDCAPRLHDSPRAR